MNRSTPDAITSPVAGENRALQGELALIGFGFIFRFELDLDDHAHRYDVGLEFLQQLLVGIAGLSGRLRPGEHW
jgi:hypothetical protein